MQTHGSTDLPVKTDEDRFWEKVDQGDDTGCWLWTGHVGGQGYGLFRSGGKVGPAHRYAYELLVGPIPTGLQIDHVWAKGCTNRHCVRPAHLEAVTQRENGLRGNGVSGRNARKTHCPKGHEYTPDNIYRAKNGGRVCRRCTLDNHRESYRRTREAQALARGRVSR